jgi:hypothetical protein
MLCAGAQNSWSGLPPDPPLSLQRSAPRRRTENGAKTQPLRSRGLLAPGGHATGNGSGHRPQARHWRCPNQGPQDFR